MSSEKQAQVHVTAPAKINLALHVVGQRDDGYHLLQSPVVFARDACDRITIRPSDDMSLSVIGPRAAGVPTDQRNLCWRAAEAFGETVSITLEKHLPHAAGIGGGSSDAAAILRGCEALFERPFRGDALALGADVPVCLFDAPCVMEGVGEQIAPLPLPPLWAVLVNPGVDVPTPVVFGGLATKKNPPMPVFDPGDVLAWLAQTRNDLGPPALAQAPVVGEALDALGDADLARMSGSGATCFGLYPDAARAQIAQARIAAERPDWWVVASPLG